MEESQIIQQKLFKIGEYSFIKEIFKSSDIVQVWEAIENIKRNDHYQHYAIKSFERKTLNQEEIQNIYREFYYLEKINNPYVVKFFDFFETKSHYFIVMELCEQDFQQFLQNQTNGVLPEAFAIHFFKQIATGLQGLHDKKIIHRDLELTNILVNREQQVRIGDLGLAKEIDNRYNMKNSVLKLKQSVAPEIIDAESVNRWTLKADIFSLGVMLYQMIYKDYPFEDKQITSYIEKIKNTKINFDQSVSNETRKLITRMLSFNPDDRPDINQVLSDEALNKKCSSVLMSFESLITKNKEKKFTRKPSVIFYVTAQSTGSSTDLQVDMQSGDGFSMNDILGLIRVDSNPIIQSDQNINDDKSQNQQNSNYQNQQQSQIQQSQNINQILNSQKFPIMIQSSENKNQEQQQSNLQQIQQVQQAKIYSDDNKMQVEQNNIINQQEDKEQQQSSYLQQNQQQQQSQYQIFEYKVEELTEEDRKLVELYQSKKKLEDNVNKIKQLLMDERNNFHQSICFLKQLQQLDPVANSINNIKGSQINEVRTVKSIFILMTTQIIRNNLRYLEFFKDEKNLEKLQRLIYEKNKIQIEIQELKEIVNDPNHFRLFFEKIKEDQADVDNFIQESEQIFEKIQQVIQTENKQLNEKVIQLVQSFSPNYNEYKNLKKMSQPILQFCQQLFSAMKTNVEAKINRKEYVQTFTQYNTYLEQIKALNQKIFTANQEEYKNSIFQNQYLLQSIFEKQ